MAIALKVGHTFIFDKAIKKEPHMRLAAYRDVVKGKDGWINANKFLPNDFDLVYMWVKGKRPIAGWRCGNDWMGLRLRKQDQILYWKRKKEDSNEK